MTTSEVALEVPAIVRDGRLQGRTVLVTGGGSSGGMAGTGAAISVLCAAKGANVVVVDRDEERAAHTQRAVRAEGGEATVVVADVTSRTECRRAAEVALTTYGRVDALVNNAAIAPGEGEADDDLWDRILALNLTATKRMIDAVLPAMRTQGVGSIVNIGSIAAFQAGGGPAYSAAKAGLLGLARAVALAEGRHGVRVNDVAPGHVAIPMGLGFQGWSGDNSAGDATRRRRARATLLGTEGTGWDVAYAVLFFASDESRYITATSLPVDGGTTKVFPIVMWPYLADVDD
jgi:NAD(P)-dependent dehydrogenase (short-subunit alcohol dehydrogenase family)